MIINQTIQWHKTIIYVTIFMFLLMYLGGKRGILIFQAQKITEWSLKQSESSSDSIILPAWGTDIKSSRSDDVSVTLVGSVMSWVKFMLSNKLLSFIEEQLNQFTLKSTKIIKNGCTIKRDNCRQ